MCKNYKIALFLNGEFYKDSFNIFFYKKILAVDGAYNYLIKNNIKPDFIIGDLDSVNKKKISKKIDIINIQNQNITDFEKSLQFIFSKKFFNVDVWGASGKSQDHFLGNLYCALKYKNKLSLIFYDKYSIYFFAKKKTIFYCLKGKKISLFPFSNVYDIITKGLKYPLVNENLSIDLRIGIRNFAIDNFVEIIFKKGALLIFIEK